MSATVKTKCVNGLDLDVLLDTIGAIQKDPELGKCKFRVANKWVDANHNCSTVCDFYGAKQENAHKQGYELHADEPPILAGKDEAANPVEHLLHALASCITTSMVAHAAVRGIHIEALESKLEGALDMRGFLGIAPDVPKGYTNIRVKFRVKTDEKNLRKLRELAEYSPVYKTITQGAKVDIDVQPM